MGDTHKPHDYATELAVLMAMTPDERSLHFLTEAYDSEVAWLDWLLQEVVDSGERIKWWQHTLKREAIDYRLAPTDEALARIEQLSEIIEAEKQLRRGRYAEIKQQRERVQCSRRKLNQRTQPRS